MFKNYDYDLKNELEQCRKSNEDNLYKFLVYKSDTSPFDCDRCDYAKAVYNKLWGFDNKIRGSFQYINVGNQNILMGMDTMNSFWITFSWALNNWCLNDIKKAFGISYVVTSSASILLSNYKQLKKIIIKNLSEDIFNKFNVFAGLTHTIGNLTLVPKKVTPFTKERQSFNQARASAWNDYFDLSMIWLCNSTDWDQNTLKAYTGKFELTDYLSSDLKINPLINSHLPIIQGNKELESRPQTIQDLSQLLDNINSRIIKRGKILYSKLVGDDNIENKSVTINNESESPVKFEKTENKNKLQKVKLFVESIKSKTLNVTPVLIIGTSIVTFIVALIMFIASGGFTRQYHSIKKFGLDIDKIKSQLTTGTVPMLYSTPVLIILGILIGMFFIYWLFCYFKQAKKYQKVAIVISLVLIGISILSDILIQILNNLRFVRNENGFFLPIDRYPFLANKKIMIPIWSAILIAFVIGIVMFCIMSYNSDIWNQFTFFIKSNILAFGAIPLLLLIIENAVPLFFIFIILLIVGIVFFVMCFGASGGGNTDDGKYQSDYSTGNSNQYDNTKCEYIDSRFLGIKVFKVHGITHDYIERDNGIVTAEICSLRDLENGNYRIYDERTKRQITAHQIPWRER